MSNKFLYFAYGSNLLAQRIHMNCPSAVRRGYGKLKNYRLDFFTYSNRWKGASATVVPAKDGIVWGAIWEIDAASKDYLDIQEGVHKNIYFAFESDIEVSDGTTLKCRVYQLCQTPPQLNENEDLPENQWPSAVYLNTIIRGAAETNLPEDYQNCLKTIPHNNYNGAVNLQLTLNK